MLCDLHTGWNSWLTLRLRPPLDSRSKFFTSRLARIAAAPSACRPAIAASTASAQRTASLQPTASSISPRASTRSAGLPVIRERCGESIRDAEFRFYDPAIASALERATEALLPHRANSSSQSAISAEISWSGWSRNRSKLSRRSEERSFLSNGTP